MSSACRRWVELSDRGALGESLTDEERAFQRDHAAACLACREEDRVWRSLGEDGPAAVPTDPEIDAVLLAAQRAPAGLAVLRRGRVVGAAAAALAIAAAVALWLAVRPAGESAPGRQSAALPQRPANPTHVPPPASPAAGGRRDGRGGPSCSEVVSGVTVCVVAEARIGPVVVDGSDRTVELASGRAVVSLVPQPPGTTFSVTTPSGKVTAVGTIFSVEVDPSGISVVRVSEGRVLVRAKATGATRPLGAGEMLRIGEDGRTPLPPGDREKDLALLPANARAHEGATSGATAPSAGAPLPSQEQMLEQAQALRARGDFRGAVELYRKIHELRPGSASGRAALVAQGELQLSSLSDPQGALNAFNAYLARGGPLSQEASFGKARALRALGRKVEERQTIERFVATYPDAPQSRVLRRRLAELE